MKPRRGDPAARSASRRRFRATPGRAAALLLAVWAVIALTLQPHRPAKHLPPQDVQAVGHPGGSPT